MASGDTTLSSLTDSIPFVIESARTIRPYQAVMPSKVETHTLAEGTGTTWDEVALSQLTATNVTENTVMDNPQEIVDTLFQITPIMTGIHTVITRRAQRRITAAVKAQMGGLAAKAMETKKDKDLIVVLDGATTSLGGAGSTFSAGLIAAGVSNIKGNTSEGSNAEIFAVIHPFQLKDVQDDIVAGVGTYTIPAGLTEDTFKRGFEGSLFGANVFTDGNITIDSLDDAKGGVFAREAIIMVQGFAPTAYTRFLEDRAGGADAMWMYDEYGLGERSAGHWLYELYSDATAPTS